MWSEAQLFGRLLAFALDDKRFGSLCQKATELHPTWKEDGTPLDNEEYLGLIGSEDSAALQLDLDVSSKDRKLIIFVDAKL